METQQDNAYTQDEVTNIIRRALLMHDIADRITQSDLEEIARQTGISRERLQRAIAEEQREHELDIARKRVHVARRQNFHAHLRAYLIVCGGWVLLNTVAHLSGALAESVAELLTLPLVFGWGIGLALHASSVFFKNNERLDTEARKLLARERSKRTMGQVKERVEGWVHEVFGLNAEDRES